MELHSYAKRKAFKKWTTEQKHRLVEARIANDAIFSKKRLNCITTWKKIVSLAKLDEFNVYFVRKQWANMVAKYKQYKRSRLGSTATNTINDELLRKVCHEWEFFYPIHTFMSRKITNLHSYALTDGQKQKSTFTTTLTQRQQDENNASLASQLATMLANNNNNNHEATSPTNANGLNRAKSPKLFSSDDTNDDYAAAETIASETVSGLDIMTECANSNALRTIKKDNAAACNGNGGDSTNNSTSTIMQPHKRQTQNTDHDFYSKKSPKHHYCLSDGGGSKATNANNVARSPIRNGSTTRKHVTFKLNNNNDNNNNNTPIIIANTFEKAMCSRTIQKQNRCINNSTTTDASEESRPPPPPTHHYYHHHQQQIVQPNLSEQDKYYRHKRRHNRRQERRFDMLLNVLGEIAKIQYPSINLDALHLLSNPINTSSLLNGLRNTNVGPLNGNRKQTDSREGTSSTDETHMDSNISELDESRAQH